jgi:glutamate formiminotransferase
MAVLAIPNISEGRDLDAVAAFARGVSQAGAEVLDIHSDPTHNRSVFTVAGEAETLVAAMTRLAKSAAAAIDLTVHTGVHPRLGGLDVCPFVPHEVSLSEAVVVAERAASAIHEGSGLPVYLYGAAARRPETRSLPELRKGGLSALIRRADKGFGPDFGSAIDPRTGVVCVGAREILIAFNVNLAADESQAREIAAAVRASGGGLPGVRALGLAFENGSQVSMNLIAPDETGIDDAFRAVEEKAIALGIEVVATEIVGLVPERYLPDPDAKAARLLVEPGRSLETALRR